MKLTRPAWIEVDLDNIAYNINSIRDLVRKDTERETEIMTVIKGGAYGHGIVEVAKVLYENGIKRIAVAMYSEALLIRKALKDVSILILGYTPSYLFDELIENSIIPTIFTYKQAKEFSDRADKLNQNSSIHIKIDTGMNRLGFKSDSDTVKIIKKINDLPSIEIEGMFSHFATSTEIDKEYTHIQNKKFDSVLRELEEEGLNIPLKHISNSGAILDLPEVHKNMVRTGIMIFGSFPSDTVKKQRIKLKETIEVKAEIACVKEIDKGEGIGYGLTFMANEKTKIATLPLGYVDLAIKALGNKGKVLVGGQEAPIVGSICMDQMMIDVTGIDANEGDVATIIGADGDKLLSVDEVAKLAGVSSFLLMSTIDKRLPRKYKKNGSIKGIEDINVKLSNYSFVVPHEAIENTEICFQEEMA